MASAKPRCSAASPSAARCKRGAEGEAGRCRPLVGTPVIAWLAVSFIWPDWNFRNIPNNIKKSSKATLDYFNVIVEQYQQGKELSIILVCTGNSRRSMMGAAMGNASAAYHGFSDLRFYSGGTTPSAFNSRSIRALKEIGFKIGHALNAKDQLNRKYERLQGGLQ